MRIRSFDYWSAPGLDEVLYGADTGGATAPASPTEQPLPADAPLAKAEGVAPGKIITRCPGCNGWSTAMFTL